MILRRIAAKIYRIGKKLILGPSRFCPVCGHKSDVKFFPIPTIYAEEQKKNGFPYSFDVGETLNYKEYSCPFCEASDRDRLYALFIERNIKPLKKYKLLDIAPARALQNFLKGKSNINYRSADLMMEGVDDKIDLMDMNIYQNNSFDIFICSHVLEHVPDDRKAMMELYRVLNPTGWGIAMVPIALEVAQIDEDASVTDIGERWRRFGQDDHLRLYSKNGFVERLEQAGFKVKQHGIEYFGKRNFEKCGIDAKSILYVVGK